jgi:hypothetical protein
MTATMAVRKDGGVLKRTLGKNQGKKMEMRIGLEGSRWENLGKSLERARVE